MICEALHFLQLSVPEGESKGYTTRGNSKAEIPCADCYLVRAESLCAG